MQVIHKPKPKPELMMQTELLAYVHELEAENARLEEAFQKATGVIAATDCVECKRGTQAKTEYDAMIAEWERDGVDLSKTGVRQKDGGAE